MTRRFHRGTEFPEKSFNSSVVFSRKGVKDVKKLYMNYCELCGNKNGHIRHRVFLVFWFRYAVEGPAVRGKWALGRNVK